MHSGNEAVPDLKPFHYDIETANHKANSRTA